MKPREKLGKNVNCESCNKEFYVNPSRLKNKHHACSKECQGKVNTKLHSQKVKTNCTICNKQILYKLSHFKQIASPCCSYKCSAKMRSIRNKGYNNPKSKKLNEEDKIFWNRAKSLKLRAEAKKINYDIDYLFLKDLFYKQNGRCSYSGIPMELKSSTNNLNLTFSVDRIDSTKGYTKDNITLCLNIINRFKGDSSVDFFNDICRAIGNKVQTTAVKVKKNNNLAKIPKYQTDGAAGFDLHSVERKVVMPGDTELIDIGLSFEIPKGYELQIRPRSGMSAKTKIRISNSPGTIDSDFRGSVKVIIDNIGNTPYTIEIGDRIAQGLLKRVEIAELVEVDDLSTTERGSGGFGSSGT